MKEQIWKPILSVLIFLALQVVFGITIGIVSRSLGNSEPSTLEYKCSLMSLTTILSGITSLFVCSLLLKNVRFKAALIPHGDNSIKTWGAIFAGGLSFICGVCATNMLSEQLAIPNSMEETFLGMSKNVFGILSISIVAPIVEEYIFREGFLGFMIRKGMRPESSIIVSSLAFGFSHLNPAQMPFAFLLGLLLGTLYWKTRNILLCGTMHMLNNTVAIYEMNEMGAQANAHEFTNLVGGPGMAWTYMAILTVASIGLMILFRKYYKEKGA